MKTKQPKIYLTLEIDQSRYLSDEDYDGIDVAELLDREGLARLLDKGYCTVNIELEKLKCKGFYDCSLGMCNCSEVYIDNP